MHVSCKALGAPLPTSLNSQGNRKITMLEKEDTYVVIIGLRGETAHYFGTPFGWNRFFLDHIAPLPIGLSSPTWRLRNHKDKFVCHCRHFCCCCLAVSHAAILLLLLRSSQVCTAAVTIGAMLPSLLILSCSLWFCQFKFSLAPSLLLLSWCWFCGWFLSTCLRQPGNGLPGGD